LSLELAPLERRLRQARKEGLIHAEYLGEQIAEAAQAEVISEKEAAELQAYHDKVSALLAVDDFAPEEMGRTSAEPAPDPTPKPAKKAAKRKQAPRKKVARKKSGSKKESAS
jgi:acyl-CoA dehydrogenase